MMRGHDAYACVVQVDLKDKWRNLLRLAVTSAVTFGKGDRRRELPAELVDKVTVMRF